MGVFIGISGGNGNDKFFDLLGPEVLKAAQIIKTNGGSIEIQFARLRVIWNKGSKPGEMISDVLPANTTALMKGTVAPVIVTQTAKMVSAFFHDVMSAMQTPKTMPAATAAPTVAYNAMIQGQATLTEQEALKMIESFKTMFPGVKAWLDKAPEKNEKPTVKPTTPVDLNKATVLGQPILGTSAGSVYRCIGLGERIRMAARYTGTALSIRVEGNLNSDEEAALKDMGFTKGKHADHFYWSNHYAMGEVPPERVIGVLFFHPQLRMTKKIETLKEASLG